MARGEIPRHNNGLINFYELSAYYQGDAVPPFGTITNTAWKNHHAYFLYKEWNKPRIAPEDRNPIDQLRIDFRASRYNRLLLLKEDEERLHLAYPTVDPEGLDPQAAEASLRDFETSDSLRFAVAGLALTRDPKYSNKRFNIGTLAPELREVSKKERDDFFTAKRDQTLMRLDAAEVTPQDVVTSIIARIAQQLNDPFLHGVAHERLDKRAIIYPFDMPHRQHAANGASRLLRQAFAAEVSVGGIESVEESIWVPVPAIAS